MKAKEITHLYWFCQSVEHKGFAAASIAAKVSAPTLSRAVAALEEALGEKLVHRNAKQFRLTAAGEAYYRKFAPLFGQLDDAWDGMSSQQTALTGEIRVSCPEPFADAFLQQLAIEFMTAHPGVVIHIEFASDTDAFVDDRIDLAVATNPPKALNLVQRKLFNLELALGASPDYLAQHGTPTEPQALLTHHLLAGNKLPFWEFHQGESAVRVPVNPRYSVDSLRLVIQAACAGLGICLIPRKTLAPLVAQGQLVPVLPEVTCPTGEVYLVWADRKLVSARVRAFREQLFERLANGPDFLTRVATASS
ncbi:LysR family transcriptional regulator [Ferrimonas balearica]|uniref:LysR family transcriptional regulator n=1 Tax=Ferrimonas balearica TaxID=44012 RepID=UPI001C9969F2|nr:LysR family transcriptional regulator [Ferrimonas balearica]MBY5991159.1 LysR family transcriptional regulator [Ferrimonas balearica]